METGGSMLEPSMGAGPAPPQPISINSALATLTAQTICQNFFAMTEPQADFSFTGA